MLRSLIHYWKSSLAVIAGVAVTTAVLTGALLVGDSLRGSLRDLTLDRLGRTEQAVVHQRFFPQDLTARIAEQPEIAGRDLDFVPALLLDGSATQPSSHRLATGIQIIGIDERFSALFPDTESLTPLLSEQTGSQIFPAVVLNEILGQELGADVGDDVLLSFGRPSSVPSTRLKGQRSVQDVLMTLRATGSGVIPNEGPGRFGLEARQVRPRNAFVDLSTLQRRLDRTHEINLVLIGRSSIEPSWKTQTEDLQQALDRSLEIKHLGLTLERGPNWVSVESSELVLRPETADSVDRIVESLDAISWPFLTYLANRMEIGDRLLPYSTISAIRHPIPNSIGNLVVSSGIGLEDLGAGQILLNTWAAEDLEAQLGDSLDLTYYLVGPKDELIPTTSTLAVVGIVEMESIATDADLTPDVPGVSDSERISSWDPPFPVDLDLVRPRDETYWEEYRGTPKAFVTLEYGQDLWRSRFGQLTAVRIAPPPGMSVDHLIGELEDRVPGEVRAARAGFRLLPVRQHGLDRASGTTDFAALFLGFSLFLIVSAALLVSLLFALLVEQRSYEAGLLLATGYTVPRVRRRFIFEGGVLGIVGTVLGTGLALAYTHAVLRGLAAWWAPVLDGPVLGVHVRPATLLLGGVSTLILVALVIVGTVRRVSKIPVRALLAGSLAGAAGGPAGRKALHLSWLSLVVALLLIAISIMAGFESAPGLFFGVGACLLVSGLASFAVWSSRAGHPESLKRKLFIPRAAARNCSRNLGRSLLSLTLVASASFVLVSVSASRKTHKGAEDSVSSGTGGFAWVAEADIALPTPMDDVPKFPPGSIQSFRLLPGDDTSCLNLYQPEAPRLLGVPDSFLERGGFRFRGTLADTEDPWSQLHNRFDDGAIPAIGDFNSVRWILHSGLGQDVLVGADNGDPLRLRIVGLLETSIFQSELLISAEHFVEHFPDHPGFAYFLGEAPTLQLDAVIAAIESQTTAFGLDAQSAAGRLRGFQAVENMYLTTFEVLGGLGLMLGTVGLGVVLLRNTLERRGELAAMRAFGFRRRTLAWMVVTENAFLLIVGLAIGSLAGLVAVAPYLSTGGIQVPWGSLAAILALVFLVGLASSIAAVASSLRVPLLPALKAD